MNNTGITLIDATQYDYVASMVANIAILQKLNPSSHMDIIVKSAKHLLRYIKQAIKYSKDYIKERLTNLFDLVKTMVIMISDNINYHAKEFQRFLYIISLSLEDIRKIIIRQYYLNRLR